MGSAASFATKSATKYKEASKQNVTKKYDEQALVGTNGTFDTSPASQQVQNELQAKEVTLVNMKPGSYRSPRQMEVKSPSSARNDDTVSAAGSEQPSYRSNTKTSREADRSNTKTSREADRNEQQGTDPYLSTKRAVGNNLTVDMVRAPSREPPADRGRGSSRDAPMSSPRARSNSRTPSTMGEKNVARTSSRKSTQQAKLEIVESEGSAAVEFTAEDMQPMRSGRRATCTGLHQAHSEAREAILKARGVNTEDPMGGLQVGMKVMGTGKVGQEMGIGTVMRKGNTPGMVMVKMDESGREMALSVAKLQTLADDKMVKTAQTLVKRVPNRSSRRASTYN
jgi:hypothetical protein